MLKITKKISEKCCEKLAHFSVDFLQLNYFKNSVLDKRFLHQKNIKGVKNLLKKYSCLKFSKLSQKSQLMRALAHAEQLTLIEGSA